MELVLKLPIGKPAFIGINFSDNIYTASILNSNFVHFFSDEPFILKFTQIEKDLLNISISREHTNLYYMYREVKFDQQKLKTFLDLNKETRLYNFSHLEVCDNVYKVLRTFQERKLFVLKINEVRIDSNEYTKPFS